MEEDKAEGSKSDSISQGSDDRRKLDRTRRTSLTASNTFPDRVLLPWEQEKDPGNHKAQAASDKANLLAHARKAHEEYIIEEARLIQARRCDAAKWEKRKPESDFMKRKSQWGFVLEEMAWMANDFTQERLWKTASASTLCRQIAVKHKRLPEFPTIDLQQCLKNHPERTSETTESTMSCKESWEATESTLNSEGEARAVPASSSTDDYAEAIPMEVVERSIRRFLGESRGQSDFPADAFQAASSPNRTSASRDSLEPRCGKFVDHTGDDSEKLDPLQVAKSCLEENVEPGREGSGVPSLQPLKLKLQEPVLCYTVPNGGCEAYRHSVEAERALLEASHQRHFSKQKQSGNPRRRKLGSSGVDEVQSLARRSSRIKAVQGHDDGAQYGESPHGSIAKQKCSKNILKSTPGVKRDSLLSSASPTSAISPGISKQKQSGNPRRRKLGTGPDEVQLAIPSSRIKALQGHDDGARYGESAKEKSIKNILQSTPQVPGRGLPSSIPGATSPGISWRRKRSSGPRRRRAFGIGSSSSDLPSLAAAGSPGTSRTNTGAKLGANTPVKKRIPAGTGSSQLKALNVDKKADAAAASTSRNVTGGGSNKPSSFKRLKSQKNSITEKNSTNSTIRRSSKCAARIQKGTGNKNADRAS